MLPAHLVKYVCVKGYSRLFSRKTSVSFLLAEEIKANSLTNIFRCSAHGSYLLIRLSPGRGSNM